MPGSVGPPPKAPSQALFLGIFAVIVVCILVLVVITLTRGGPDEWVEATRATGTWTSTVSLMGPQVSVEERWERDCINDPIGTVLPRSCIPKETDAHQDVVVDDYEEYAYTIYYEEMWDRIYQARGSEFVQASLGSDDYWEEETHYTRIEELDRDSCEYTQYTVWVDDRQESSQEVEVYLAECEVWDHVTVSEREYEQDQWCGCEKTTLVPLGQDSHQGLGTSVIWPQPDVPTGGNTERSFSGTVTFEGDGYAYTTTTDDVGQYLDYLTNQYYIALRDGKAVSVRNTPP
ncbi:hypothetical protein ACFLWA_02050 [Chloroflexota bacterium]